MQLQRPVHDVEVHPKVRIVLIQPVPVNAMLPESLTHMVEMRSPFLHWGHGIAPIAIWCRAADFHVPAEKTGASMAYP